MVSYKKCNPQNIKAVRSVDHVGVFITDSLLDERVVGCCYGYHYSGSVKCGSSVGSLAARSKGRWSGALQSAARGAGVQMRARESLLLLAAHYCLVVTLKNYQSRLSPTWETKHVAARETANLQAAKLQTTQEGLFALMFGAH